MDRRILSRITKCLQFQQAIFIAESNLKTDIELLLNKLSLILIEKAETTTEQDIIVVNRAIETLSNLKLPFSTEDIPRIAEILNIVRETLGTEL